MAITDLFEIMTVFTYLKVWIFTQNKGKSDSPLHLGAQKSCQQGASGDSEGCRLDLAASQLAAQSVFAFHFSPPGTTKIIVDLV